MKKPMITGAARAELTPTGKLRVALNCANFLLVGRSASGFHGVAPDLGHALAEQLGVQAEFIGYDNAGLAADAAPSGVWDVAFIGAEPARANQIAFTPAYVEIEATFMVPPGSAIRTIDEVDRPGVRIAVADRAAYDLFLSRSLAHARLVRAEGIQGSYDLFVREGLEVLAGLKPRLLEDLTRLPGARILDGRFTAIQQAMGTPREREAAAQALRAFGEDAKASGLVARLIERHGVRGLSVAPPAA